jgi:hypothetical protein
MATRETSSTAYSIMLTTEIIHLDAENRDENRKLLKQKKSLIIKQISAAKSKVLKYLDDIEERLITNCFHDGSTSRNIMTLIIYKKKILTFLIKKKINIIILKFRLF